VVDGEKGREKERRVDREGGRRKGREGEHSFRAVLKLTG
jgi:hypothetical protein